MIHPFSIAKEKVDLMQEFSQTLDMGTAIMKEDKETERNQAEKSENGKVSAQNKEVPRPSSSSGTTPRVATH